MYINLKFLKKETYSAFNKNHSQCHHNLFKKWDIFSFMYCSRQRNSLLKFTLNFYLTIKITY